MILGRHELTHTHKYTRTCTYNMYLIIFAYIHAYLLFLYEKWGVPRNQLLIDYCNHHIPHWVTGFNRMGSGFVLWSQDRALLDQKSGGAHWKQRGLGRSEGPGCHKWMSVAFGAIVSIDLDCLKKHVTVMFLLEVSHFQTKNNKLFVGLPGPQVLQGSQRLNSFVMYCNLSLLCRKCSCLFWCAFETLRCPWNRVW